MAPSGKMVFIDMPVSNNGARIRLLVRMKKIQDKVEVKSPMDYGGLKTPEFLKVNPQGKFPVLILEDGTSFTESQVGLEYLNEVFGDVGPIFRAPTPELRAKANLINRVHDIYLASANCSQPGFTGTQGCLYKSVSECDRPSRAAKVKEIAKQLDYLEELADAGGPYLVGESITLADLALYPTFIFFEFMLPLVFGWPTVLGNRPKLQAWMTAMEQIAEVKEVRGEIWTALEGWKSSGRFDPIIEETKDTAFQWVY